MKLILALCTLLLVASASVQTLTCEDLGFDGGTLVIDTSRCFYDPPSAPGLANAMWTAIPGSEMETVYDPLIDGIVPGGHRSFESIQVAWSGGVCVGNELFVWGGGHGDGANNSLFAVDVVTGAWRRVGPNPTTAVYIGVKSQTNPDGSPAARHTYDLMVADSTAIYAVGGGVWNEGGTLSPTSPPPTGLEASSWKFTLPSGPWSNFAMSPSVNPVGSMEIANGKIYHLRGGGRSLYDVASNTWGPLLGGNNASAGTVLVYSPDSDRLYGLGGGYTWHRTPAQWPTSTRTNIPNTAVSEGKYWGNTYYPPERRVLLWDGGPALLTYSELIEAWETITPAGDPGPRTSAGSALGRLSYCGGRVVLANGVARPLYYLEMS